MAEEDYAKAQIVIKKGRSSNWIPHEGEVVPGDPFGTKESERFKPPRMGRPAYEGPLVECPVCTLLRYFLQIDNRIANIRPPDNARTNNPLQIPKVRKLYTTLYGG